MSYYWFNRKEIFQKAKERYSKEKVAENYLQNKEAIKEKSKNRYKILSKEEKDKIKEHQRKNHQQLIQNKKEALQSKLVLLLKAKLGEFNGVIKTNFLGDEVPKENEHYTCIAYIAIDFVMRIEKKNYPQVYLAEWKYRMKKTKMTKLIEVELKSESELQSDIELELKSDTE